MSEQAPNPRSRPRKRRSKDTRPGSKNGARHHSRGRSSGRSQSQGHAPEASLPPALPREEWAEPQGAFRSLIPKLQNAVAAQGYSTPTPIQEQCISQLLDGADLIGTAQTGTGKTAAFVLPLLQRLAEDPQRPSRGTPRALILAPTRELAAQIGQSIQVYGRYLKLNHTVIFGGVSQFQQVRSLNRGTDVLVATPGRLLDLMEQGYIRLDKVDTFILDEVDRMLDMGFIPDIERVLSELPKNRQTMFFSATMAPKMLTLAHTMVENPVLVTITPDKPAVERIEQKILFVGKKNKDALLVSMLSEMEFNKVLIFTQMKHAADRVVDHLFEAGLRSTAIHGNKSQAARTKALDSFKRGRIRILVATDVAARGLDVDDITHVINYDLPIEAETYIHRIGRTARAGADGDALSFCSAEERAYLRDIERLLGQTVPVDMDHAYHCNEAYNSRQPAPRNFGRGRGRGGGGGGGGRHGGKRRGGGGKRPYSKKRSH